MSSLDPALAAALETGQIAIRDLIRIDLPGKTVGYHSGGRRYTYNGLTYEPNRWLSAGTHAGALGPGVSTRTLVFKYDKRVDSTDVISTIESYAYLNAPVVITTLAGLPKSNEVLGILSSSIYEIAEVRFVEGAADANGVSEFTVEIDIQPPGRSARGSTLIKVSPADHNFDNDATDTCLEYVATNATISEEWGQTRG